MTAPVLRVGHQACGLMPVVALLLLLTMPSLLAVAKHSSPVQLLQRFNRQSVLLRLQFLGNAQRGGPSHTVLVTDIPGVSPVGACRVRPYQWGL